MGGLVQRTGLAVIHEGENVMTRAQVREFTKERFWNALQIPITINAGGGLGDLDPDSLARLVGQAVAGQIRTRGGWRGLIKDTARSGL